jgi:hypothetical protein
VIEYRAYAVDKDGHIVKAIPLICDDDTQAIDKAMEILGDCTIEVWSGDRLVVRSEGK